MAKKGNTCHDVMKTYKCCIVDFVLLLVLLVDGCRSSQTIFLFWGLLANFVTKFSTCVLSGRHGYDCLQE